MISAAATFHGPQRHLVAVGQSHIIDVYFQFARATHASFGMGLSDGGDRHRAAFDDHDIANFDIVKDFKINSVVNLRVLRRHGPS